MGRVQDGGEEAFGYYVLAKEFHIKPSEVGGQPWKVLNELMIIYDEETKAAKKETEKLQK